MSGHTSREDLSRWLPAGALLAVLLSLAYVVGYGGDPSTPLLALWYGVGLAASAFVLWLLYRFVVAVETIAEKL